MKKSAIFGKRQLVLAVLVMALGVAVWLNMKYASTEGGFDITGALNSSKYLGEAQYVDNPVVNNSDGATSTDVSSSVTASADGSNASAAAPASTGTDYFETARKDRTAARKEAIELLQDTFTDVKADSAAKDKAIADAAEIAKRIEKESSIETLIKAKGFADTVVVISEKDVSVVVKSDKLISTQTMQIQDIVQSQVEMALDKIKIIPVK